MSSVTNIVSATPTEDGAAISLVVRDDKDQETAHLIPHNLVGDLVAKIASANDAAAKHRADTGTPALGPELATTQGLAGWDVYLDNVSGLGVLRLKMKPSLNYDIRLAKEDVEKMIGLLQVLGAAMETPPKLKPKH